MGRKVTVIPPTISLQTHLPTTQKVKRKVAGYARVSTDFEEQLTSYVAQVDYYTKYIQEREDWSLSKSIPMRASVQPAQCIVMDSIRWWQTLWTVRSI